MLDFVGGQEVGDVHYTDPVVRIERGELTAWCRLQPRFEGRTGAAIEGVEQQHGQGEVVGPVTLFREFELIPVALVDFREEYRSDLV